MDNADEIKLHIRQSCLNEKYILEESGLNCHQVAIAAITEITFRDDDNLPDTFKMARIKFLDLTYDLHIAIPTQTVNILKIHIEKNPVFPKFLQLAHVSSDDPDFQFMAIVLLHIFCYDEEIHDLLRGSIFKFPLDEEIQFEYPVDEELLQGMIEGARLEATMKSMFE